MGLRLRVEGVGKRWGGGRGHTGAEGEVPAWKHLAKGVEFRAQGSGCRDKALAGPGVKHLGKGFGFRG